ncbi:uncharacterized protein LOC110681527 isoform X2 [Aedes aegypti]|uniref:Uncharacterized protein n=1 Tax=Aedes aegypti TaxID=7159 RepID=A0A6I8TNP2_AEDAE|nr:uncharacterized protein LOC110681527 isoform X2 [Aedes aegypti]
MPRTCAIFGCSKRGDRDGEKWFRFPLVDKRTEQREELSKTRQVAWLNAIKRVDLVPEKWASTVVCSQHFISGRSADLLDEMNPDWVPNQNLGYANRITPAAVDKFERAARRNENKEAREVQESILAVEDFSTHPVPIDRVAELEDEIKSLRREMQLMRDKHQPFLCNSFEDFGQNDDKCRYFTALNYKVFKSLYKFLEPHLPQPATSFGTTKFQILLFTLSKLRLDIDLTLIAYMSGVHLSTISRYYHKCIYVMFQRLKGLVSWPSREAVQNSMPQCFRRRFGDKVSVVIDCFEILTEKPSEVLQAAQMWSNYKHSHTVKYLIGIAPNGMIIFISNAFGGRASDKFITEKSALLSKMQKGDYIMADRGFLIKNYVENTGVELLLPAFTVGQDQLHPLDIEKTRKLANVRIHVERVIVQLRNKYKILYKNKFPISTLKRTKNYCETPLMDQIVTVCCSLVNLCPSVVPED